MRRMLPGALALMSLSGCAASVEFSKALESNGVAGKSWRTPYFVDSEIYQPGFQTRSNFGALVSDFDIATYGTSLQLVTSHWDPLTTSTYRGYGRLYQDEVGWSDFGPDFGQIAADGSVTWTGLKGMKMPYRVTLLDDDRMRVEYLDGSGGVKRIHWYLPANQP